MKKFAASIALLMVSLTFAFGQTTTDTISMKKKSGGFEFYQGENRLTMNQLIMTIKPNEQAYSQIKSAQANYTFALVLSYAGGFMVGYPIGTAIGGGDPNWLLAGIGASLIVFSIPLSQSFNTKAKQAIDTYNRGLQTSSSLERSELKFSISENGIGLVLRF
ncbi:MAG: hypothetical protein FD170_2606 [Bacteroidetes bacterium]|nr:MAG: hypothetical protein FD170_2606 [Bacteroidota bacterium]